VITPDTIEKILDATQIEEVIGEFVSLKKRGINLIGLCPFHNEKTPSFTVSAAKGIFKCFGCGKGGNAVNFLMEQEHFSYPEALRYLAGKYGIEIEEEKPSPEQQQVLDEKESLFNLSAFAQKYFQEQLHQSEEGKAIALSYLKERGFSAEIIRKFGVGYCHKQWDDFTRFALKNGYKKEYLIKASLSRSKDQMLYDAFRGRIVFPIHNLSGRVLGFGARIMGNDPNKPKYINSSESDIYHKSRVLYGLYFGKSAVVEKDNCYLVEGYTDVISLHQAGIENVIASSGTSLTIEQIRLIRRYTSQITLLFDGDPAGIKAAFRGIDMILEEGMNVRLVLFPEGEDPDSYAQKHRPLEVKAFLEENATDFITFKTELLLGDTLNDPIKKAGLIREIAATIALIPEPIARAMYVKTCSQAMEVDEPLLFAEINKLRRKKKGREKEAEQEQQAYLPEEFPQPAGPQQKQFSPTSDAQEKEVIRLLLNHASEHMTFEVENEDKRMETISVRVMDFILQDIEEDNLRFENEACQIIYNTFIQARADQTFPNQSIFVNHPDKTVSHLVIDLLSSPHTLSKNWENRHRIYVNLHENDLKKHVLDVVYSLKLRKLEIMIDQNRRQMKEETDPDRLFELLKNDHNLKKSRSRFALELSRIVTR
jgi:DNA primase